jgi:peroxiredoxin
MKHIATLRLLHQPRTGHLRLRHYSPLPTRKPEKPLEKPMSLQAKLDKFKADFEAGKPPYSVSRAVINIMHRATEELIASGAAARALKAGDVAPPFVLKDSGHKAVSSAALLAQGPLVVSFYRGVWCPYCNMELQGLQEALPAFRELGAQLVAISPQKAANSRKSIHINGLEFPILSDPGNETAAAFGLRFALPDYLVELYKSLKNDLPAFNGEASWTLPIPGRFVIGQDRVIRYAEVDPDYTHRPEPEELIPALQKAAARNAACEGGALKKSRLGRA